MTKKDYQMIADVIKKQHEETLDWIARCAIETIACDLACEFECDNPNFKRDKFLEACGIS